jgi:hypothetical protein
MPNIPPLSPYPYHNKTSPRTSDVSRATIG